MKSKSLKLSKYAVALFALSFASTSFAAKFDICVCDVQQEDGPDATGILYGEVFVKQSDGAMTVQKIEFTRKSYSCLSAWGPCDPASIALQLCQGEEQNFVKAGVCPSVK